MRAMAHDAGQMAIALILVVLCWCVAPSHAQTAADNPRAGRFPKVTLQSADKAAPASSFLAAAPEAHVPDNNPVDFYNEFVKGKTVLINFFYTRCDGNICDQGTQNLVQLQKALGDRLGSEVFIYSITLDPEHDTPEVLRAYAKKYGAKPGWTFLRGSPKDIAALREKLGLGNPKRELSRKLTFATAKGAAAGKIIEAKPPMTWEPNALTVFAGDTVQWKMGGDAPGTHGVRITNWETVKDKIDLEPAEGQQPFNSETGKNDTPTEAAGKMLLRLKIKADLAVPAKITYECIVHGDLMAGEVSLGQQHAAMIYIFNDPADRKDTMPILATPNQILDSIERLKPRKE